MIGYTLFILYCASLACGPTKYEKVQRIEFQAVNDTAAWLIARDRIKEFRRDHPGFKINTANYHPVHEE